MTAALIYTFAVSPDVGPVAGAASPTVLARQLPRLAVQLLNGDADRGVRFFPLIGVQDGRRQFLEIDELLDLEVVGHLHREKVEPLAVVDGCIHQDVLQLRILDGAEDGGVTFDEEIPFDHHAPLPAVARLMFELMGQLGWAGAPPATPELAGPALADFLQGRDDLLRLEANLVVHEAGSALAAVQRALAAAPLAAAVHQLLLDLVRRLLARGEAVAALEQLLPQAAVVVARAAPAEPRAADSLEELASVVHAGGLTDAACAVSEQVLAIDPAHPHAACRVASAVYGYGDVARAREVLARSVAAGSDDSLVLTQLAVVSAELGDLARRDALVEQLAARDDLTLPAVRVVTAYLLEGDRAAEALPLVERALREAPDDASLTLDLGRTLLQLDRQAEAATALNRCLSLDPDPAVRREAERHLGLAHVPHSLSAAREIDRAIRGGDVQEALTLARAFVRRAPELAESWLLLGVVRHRLSQPRRAERALRRALEVNPDCGEAHNRLGILLVARGRYGEARDHLHDAMRLLPDEPSPRIHLAQACHYLGEADAGRAALAEAERLGGDQKTLAAVREAFFDDA